MPIPIKDIMRKCIFCEKEISQDVRRDKKYCSKNCASNDYYNKNLSKTNKSIFDIIPCEYEDESFETKLILSNFN